jgi:hypothetical protein
MMQNLSAVIVILGVLAACSDPVPQDNRSPGSPAGSAADDSESMVAQPTSIAGAFLTCDMMPVAEGDDVNQSGLDVSCELEADILLDDWEFFSPDKEGSVTKLSAVSAEQSAWQLNLSIDNVVPGEGISIMARSDTAEDHGMPKVDSGMHAVWTISQQDVDQFMESLGNAG